MPSATGIASSSANTETNTVTWSRSRMPKGIAEVSVVTQLPLKRKKFASLRASAGTARHSRKMPIAAMMATIRTPEPSARARKMRSPSTHFRRSWTGRWMIGVGSGNGGGQGLTRPRVRRIRRCQC